MYSPSYCGIAKNSMLMFGIRFPDEATYPYNDKIVFYTNNSCYPEGVIFEIDINDIEVE